MKPQEFLINNVPYTKCKNDSERELVLVTVVAAAATAAKRLTFLSCSHTLNASTHHHFHLVCVCTFSLSFLDTMEYVSVKATVTITTLSHPHPPPSPFILNKLFPLNFINYMGFVWHLYSIHSMIHSRLCSYFIHVVWWNTTQHSTHTHSLAQDASINISYQYYVFYVQILTVTHTHQHTAYSTHVYHARTVQFSDQFMFRWIVGCVCVSISMQTLRNAIFCYLIRYHTKRRKPISTKTHTHTHARASISKIQNGLCEWVRESESKCV